MNATAAATVRNLGTRGPTLAAAAGIFGLVRAGVGFADPRYYDPSTLLDYSAVVLTTLTLVFAGLALLATRPFLGRVAATAVFVPACALIVVGVSNLIEDAFGVSPLGLVWGVGNLIVLAGCLVTGIAAIIASGGSKLVGAAILAFGGAVLLPEVGEIAASVALLFLAWTLSRPRSVSTEGAEVPA